MPSTTDPLLIPNITTLPHLPPSRHTTLLTTLFEPSPHLHTLLSPLLTSPAPPYPSYTSLISTTIRARLYTLIETAKKSDEDREVLDSILKAHPRLGAPKALKEGEGEGEGVSELSRREQEAGGLNEGEREREELARLNERYEERFGGLKYVVFVNGRGRDVIMEDMRRRIERGDVELERKEAVDAMCDIALDRVQKLTGEGCH